MTFPLSIFSLDRKIFEGNATALTLPGKEGEIQVLAGHTPLIALLKEGDILIARENNANQKLPIGGGVVEVRPEKVIVLANF